MCTVEEADGLSPVGQSATAAPILDIWAAGNTNQPPVAAFTSSCTQLTCLFNASGSSDPDGTIAGYAWAFGDGTSGTGVAPPHAYATAGTRTVTDYQGASPSVSHPVAVAATATVLVSDSFKPTVTVGLGSADVGGAWPGARSYSPARAFDGISSGPAGRRVMKQADREGQAATTITIT